MKYKLIQLGISSLMLLSGTQCLNANIPEFTLNDLDTPFLEGWATLEEKEELNSVNCIIHIQEGDEIPLKFDLDGTILAFKEKPTGGTVIALQSLYLKIQNGNFSFSLDKETWKPFEAFFGGILSASLGRSESSELIGGVFLETHLK